MSVESTSAAAPMAIEVNNLNFRYERSQALYDISFKVPRGARVALLGANGAGKSTLLRVLGGKHMLFPAESVMTMGKPAFRTDHAIEYLGSNWTRTVAFAGYNVQYQADMAVSEMSVELQAEFPERRDYLYRLLEVEPTWRMHELSDGQRRRVQLLLGLIRPFDLLVMDEITVDLDVVTRQDFMNFLKQESESRGATIVYATHIFDGLEEWASHMAYISYGKLTQFGEIQTFPELQKLREDGYSAPLLQLIANWLRADRAARKVELARLAAEEAERKQKQAAEEAKARGSKTSTNNGWGAGRFNSHFA